MVRRRELSPLHYSLITICALWCIHTKYNVIEFLKKMPIGISCMDDLGAMVPNCNADALQKTGTQRGKGKAVASPSHKSVLPSLSQSHQYSS